MMGIKNLAVSSGSACTSASLEPSYVLKALGVSEELAHTSLRIGIGRYTSEKDVRDAVKVIVNEVKRLRSLSPLWEMAQEGVDISKIKWAHH
jgi:cysteine desulfurase